MPYRSKRKQAASNRKSTAKWYKEHKAERAAYMRKYRKRLKRSKKVRPGSKSPHQKASWVVPPPQQPLNRGTPSMVRGA